MLQETQWRTHVPHSVDTTEKIQICKNKNTTKIVDELIIQDVNYIFDFDSGVYK